MSAIRFVSRLGRDVAVGDALVGCSNVSHRITRFEPYTASPGCPDLWAEYGGARIAWVEGHGEPYMAVPNAYPVRIAA